MSQYGQLKKILPFRAMSKRCKFTILQGMSTKIIPQTHPNIINVQRHHSNTIQYPQNIPKALFMHNLKWTQTNRHSLTSQDPPRCCLKLAESVCWRQLMSVGMCWLLLLSGYVLSCRRWGMGGVGVMAVYEWCLWVSEVFAGVWRVISVLIPWMVENSYCFGIVLKSRIVFTRPNWDIKMSTYNYISWTKIVGFCHFFSSLVFVREKSKDTFTWITLYCC